MNYVFHKTQLGVDLFKDRKELSKLGKHLTNCLIEYQKYCIARYKRESEDPCTILPTNNYL